jgi:hypothetical protein
MPTELFTHTSNNIQETPLHLSIYTLSDLNQLLYSKFKYPDDMMRI